MPIFCFEMASFITEDPNCRCGVAHFGRNGRTRGVFFFKAGKRIPLFQIAQTVKQLFLFCDELLTISLGQS